MEHQAADIGAQITYVDGIFIAVLALSCVVGLIRGFTRELLGIINWVGAIAITLWGFPLFSPFVRSHISNYFVADIGLYIVLFVVSIVVLSAISRAISGQIKSSTHGGVDRSLGLLFGVARTFILMAITFAGVLYFSPTKVPLDFKNARSYPLFEQSFLLSAHLIPETVLAYITHKEPGQNSAVAILRGEGGKPEMNQGSGSSLEEATQKLSSGLSQLNTLDPKALVDKLSNLKIQEQKSGNDPAPRYNEEHRSTLDRLVLNHSEPNSNVPSTESTNTEPSEVE
jgi:uncharacterized membrane protein required for colicin V production